jgi:uncharacterized protein YebE (UPF0316 family)
MLRQMGFGVTAVQGEGRDGSVLILFVVAPRRRGKEVVRAVEKIDPEAFVTVEPISHALRGYLPDTTGPASLKK